MFLRNPFIANLFGSGRPWYRVISQAAGNVWFKVRGRHPCCGRPGTPGC